MAKHTAHREPWIQILPHTPTGVAGSLDYIVFCEIIVWAFDIVRERGSRVHKHPHRNWIQCVYMGGR